ncbi:TetR/AcrR family transcriptional regulator [Stenotrophomonas tumulicola]|uniref:TetR/AcrR family transcriptional regulator n=1 Tax=Stenotrophomonas tumulicola TaxID=1685415 RepID=A0A7W3FN69_9GAMM|nr:TetR/AcrR family transcriptional regulator [Stenotrophomonas tumulicola]MBA8682600.1 TetR/AcrR family transcriptional regulator [Stenotrophomonas tumulicola]
MRYRPDQKQVTRDRVLKTAARQVRERGPARMALARVMADAGLTHGGFYAHFPSKDAFLRATVERMFDDSPFSALRDQSQSPAESVANFVDFYLSPAHRDTREGGCPLPFLVADAPRLPQDIRERVAEGASALSGYLARHLEALGYADAEDEASSCVAEIIGAMVLARAEPDRLRSDAILARSRSAILHRLTLQTCP